MGLSMFLVAVFLFVLSGLSECTEIIRLCNSGTLDYAQDAASGDYYFGTYPDLVGPNPTIVLSPIDPGNNAATFEFGSFFAAKTTWWTLQSTLGTASYFSDVSFAQVSQSQDPYHLVPAPSDIGTVVYYTNVVDSSKYGIVYIVDVDTCLNNNLVITVPTATVTTQPPTTPPPTLTPTETIPILRYCNNGYVHVDYESGALPGFYFDNGSGSFIGPNPTLVLSNVVATQNNDNIFVFEAFSHSFAWNPQTNKSVASTVSDVSFVDASQDMQVRTLQPTLSDVGRVLYYVNVLDASMYGIIFIVDIDTCVNNVTITIPTPTTSTPTTTSPTTASPTTTLTPTTVSPTTVTPTPTLISTTTAPTTVAPTVTPTTTAPTVTSTTIAPTVTSTTIAPTLIPTTTSPTVTPTTAAQTVTPTTAAPTLTPTTAAPTLTPTTVAPTVTPTTVAPTVTPTTVTPTVATVTPTTVSPNTLVPTTTTGPMTAGPITVGPTTPPSTAVPSTVAPTTTTQATTAPPTSAPTTLTPTTMSATASSTTLAATTSSSTSTSLPTTAAPTIPTTAPATAPATSGASTSSPSTNSPSTSNPTTVGETTSSPSTVVPTTTSTPATTVYPTIVNASTASPLQKISLSFRIETSSAFDASISLVNATKVVVSSIVEATGVNAHRVTNVTFVPHSTMSVSSLKKFRVMDVTRFYVLVFVEINPSTNSSQLTPLQVWMLINTQSTNASSAFAFGLASIGVLDVTYGVQFMHATFPETQMDESNSDAWSSWMIGVIVASVVVGGGIVVFVLYRVQRKLSSNGEPYSGIRSTKMTPVMSGMSKLEL